MLQKGLKKILSETVFANNKPLFLNIEYFYLERLQKFLHIDIYTFGL
jgi:hypothetical protein